jgi:16S rRNA C967 or C1407 C5-methylase (RsmB/RsmF family)/NOL1/NOP2/fmu family ribosome biogenesis protein
MMPVSFPPEFEKRMQVILKDEWESFVKTHQSASPTSIRINPHKTKSWNENKIPWTDFGYYLKERPAFTFDPLFHAGTYYVQEPSSMLLEQVIKQTLDVSIPLRVLDLCGAPGGKSTHLLSLLTKDSLLVSNEVIRSRAQVLAENVVKWGCSNVVVSNNDPEVFQRLPGFFDLIVVDAPCSGEGLFRKDPGAMQEWSTDHTTLCSHRQRRILKDVWPALKENGILIYSTCTYNPDENENNLTWLAQQESIQQIPIKLNPDWKVKPVVAGNLIGYQCFPHAVLGEGFFFAAVRKSSQQAEIKIRTGKSFHLASKKIVEQLSSWVLCPEHFCIIQQQDLLLLLPAERFDEFNFLSQQLHVVSKGTAMAEIKHEKLIPEHSLALSIHLNKLKFISFELSLEQALTYLRKETLNQLDTEKGFALVTYQNHPLGWINRLGNRINNLYPAAWRIRQAG